MESRIHLTDDDVEALRAAEFPASARAVHLKASGGSPLCRSAFEAQTRYLQQMCFEGDIYYSDYLKDLDRARERIAAYIGAHPNEICFSVNSSSAASIATDMLIRAGVKRVYHPVSEFPTSTHALSRAHASMHAPFTLVPVGDPDFRDTSKDWLDAVKKHLDENPQEDKSALVASHVCYLNGETLDISAAGALCKERNLLFVLNATQSFGALSIDVSSGTDMVFATGLKWAFAGYGAGFLYIRQSLVDRVGLPAGTGWLSVADPYRMDNRNTSAVQAARSLDAGGGMPHFGPLLGMNGALSMFERIGGGDIRRGIESVEERVKTSANYLSERLQKKGFDLLGNKSSSRKSGIVSIVSDRAKDLAKMLSTREILVSLRAFPTSENAAVLRFGVHFFNTKNELDSALSVLV
jgi:cysteine desulfurase / selenocysteine lyase